MKYEFDPEKSEGTALFLMIAIFFGGTFLLNGMNSKLVNKKIN